MSKDDLDFDLFGDDKPAVAPAPEKTPARKLMPITNDDTTPADAPDSGADTPADVPAAGDAGTLKDRLGVLTLAQMEVLASTLPPETRSNAIRKAAGVSLLPEDIALQEDAMRVLNGMEDKNETPDQKAAKRTTLPTDGDGTTQTVVNMINELHIVKYAGGLWYIPDGQPWYQQDAEDSLKNMIYGFLPYAKTKVIDEVYKQIGYRLTAIDDTQDFGVRFKNGLLKDGAFTKTADDDFAFTPFYIGVEYDPDAPAVDVVDDYLDHLTSGTRDGATPDADYRSLMEEVIGYCLVTDPKEISAISKFFILVGDGKNGKGTFIKTVEKILGNANRSNLSMDQMASEKFSNRMIGKLANLGDDIEDKPITEDKMKMLKNISAADTITTRALYQAGRETTIIATMIFTSNAILSSYEKGFAFKRRVMWLPMRFTPTKPDPMLVKKMTTPAALKYWARLIVAGYMRLYTTGSFTQSQIVDDFNTGYHESNNSVQEWLGRMTDPENAIIGRKVPEVREAYERWCLDSGLTVLSARILKTTLKEQLSIESITTTARDSSGKRRSLKAYAKIGEDGKPVAMTLPQSQQLRKSLNYVSPEVRRMEADEDKTWMASFIKRRNQEIDDAFSGDPQED